MYKKFILAIFAISISAIGFAQTNADRIIEVKGSAEMEVEPDEITFNIGIEEYWKEEFEKRKEFKDYKTKIPLAEIEDALIKDLRKVGIPKDDIVVKNMGNYWRHRGKEFLYSKQFQVKITDLSKVNELTKIVDSKGIKYMNIGKLNHSNMDELKKQVKINALKAAQKKASYLLESIGEELGEVFSISELSDSYNRPMYANTMMRAADAGQESISQVQNIKLSYQVTAKFRIK